MQSPAVLRGVSRVLVIVAAAAPAVLAAPRSDVAVLRIRVLARVNLGRKLPPAGHT